MKRAAVIIIGIGLVILGSILIIRINSEIA